ncbi:hypothetical protein CE91St36_07520 [Christensenellaceae bacterium]|nr:hypothetical protein CE91St36_07520 [Christensenellaceae bacterium]BDF60603.1 hypothetical protein CE91St37_07530 [Christensenellaceae bacterium]
MRLSKREIVLLIILGIVVIVVLGVNFLIVPMQKTLAQSALDVEQKRLEMETVQKETAMSGEMTQMIEQTYARTRELQKPYENSLKQEEIDLWLNTQLAQNNLEVQNLDISDVKVATADFETAPLNELEPLPIQDAADIVNGGQEQPPEEAAPTDDTGAQEAGAETQAASAPEDTGGNTTSLYQIDAVVSCIGGFDDVIAFSNSLYESGRALRITSITTQSPGEDGRTGAVITIEFYGIPAVQNVTETATGEEK